MLLLRVKQRNSSSLLAITILRTIFGAMFAHFDIDLWSHGIFMERILSFGLLSSDIICDGFLRNPLKRANEVPLRIGY
jgi:hypothetical protein